MAVWFLDRLPGLAPGFYRDSVPYQCWSVSLHCLACRWLALSRALKPWGLFEVLVEVWVASEETGWLHRFLTAHVGWSPKGATAARLSQWHHQPTLARFPAPQQDLGWPSPPPPSISLFPFQEFKLCLRGFRCCVFWLQCFMFIWVCLLDPGDPPTAIGHPRVNLALIRLYQGQWTKMWSSLHTLYPCLSIRTSFRLSLSFKRAVKMYELILLFTDSESQTF